MSEPLTAARLKEIRGMGNDRQAVLDLLHELDRIRAFSIDFYLSVEKAVAAPSEHSVPSLLEFLKAHARWAQTVSTYSGEGA